MNRSSGGAGRLAALAPRRWSIGLRTAVAFGAVSALLTALVVVLVSATTTTGITIDLVRVASVQDASEASATAWPSEPPPSSLRCDEGRCASTGPGADADGAPLSPVVAKIVARQQWVAASVGVALVAVVAGVVGWFVSRRMLRPLDAVVATTRRITASTLHERVALPGPRDEVARVADTIDELLDRLEASFEAQRRFVADASHELRTPLAVQRAVIQIGLDDPTPDELARAKHQLLEANRRSDALIESLLALATADRGLADAGRRVELGEVVSEVVSGVLDLARASSVDVIVARGTFHRVQGDAVLVGQLVRNLVANAVEYNEPGGWVRVHGSADAVLVIENTGPVVTAQQAATLTRPFVRGEERVGGRPGGAAEAPGGDAAAPGGVVRHSGLGLAIVASVAAAHGWALQVDPREGGGLRVSLR